MNNKGSVLVVTMLLVVILALLGASICLTGVNESFTVRRNLLAGKAFWVAEAGLQRTVWNIKSNNCSGMTNVETGLGCQACNACGQGRLKLTGDLPQGGYSAVYDPAGKVIISDGGVPSLAAPLVRRQLEVFSRKKELFGPAAFAGAAGVPLKSEYDPFAALSGGGSSRVVSKKAAPAAFDPYDWQEVQ